MHWNQELRLGIYIRTLASIGGAVADWGSSAVSSDAWIRLFCELIRCTRC